MRKIITTTMCFLLLTAFAQAQKITGKVQDENQKPITKATVSLHKAKDSSVAKIDLTNDNGVFEFNTPNGKYFITISYIGFTKYSSTIFNVEGSYTVPTITLTKASKSLNEVTVTSKKPMIEVKADKTIFNIEGSINAVGTDAFELLRKSPGVMVDREDNISMNGKNGVQIYIDGRPTPLTQKDLANYLKSMQSSNIEAIELITNPSAKYDAAGNAGIINIRLKKNKSFGANGSINGGYAVGTYSKYNGGANLNYRNKKINAYGSYNYNRSLNFTNMNIFRKINVKGVDSSFDSKGTMTNFNNGHNFKAGIDLYSTKRSTFGIMATGNFAETTMDNYSATDIIVSNKTKLYRKLIADNTSAMHNNSMNYNANYKYTDTSGRELNIDLNYGNFDINNNQLQPNKYYNDTGFNFLNRNYQMISPTKIDIYSGKIDYEQNLMGGKLETGVKYSNVSTTNDFQRFDGIGVGQAKDELRSNSFTYKEKVSAAYFNFNKQYNNGVMIQVGLRVENTNSNGTSTGKKEVAGSLVNYDSIIVRDYTNLFPSAAITFNKNPMSQWSFTYSRRIDRPAYQDLNPFEFKLDEYQYQKGNTRLTPQFTNSFGVSHTYKYMLTTSINYSRVTDVFAQLIDTSEVSKAFITKKNLATQDIVSLNISYPLQKGMYSAYFNISGNYSKYKATFDDGNTVDLDATAANLYMQHSFQLGKGYNAELSSWYSTPSIQEGTFVSKAMGYVDIGISKQIMQGKGTIKMAVSDIFRTMRWAGNSNFAGQALDASFRWESQQFKLNFNYRFGKNTVKGARKRETGAEDESKRVKAGGGGLGGS